MPRSTRDAAAPTIVLFVRHGTTPTTGKVLPGQGRGLHLSDRGRAEADAVAARIGQLPEGTVSAVYASHLERAQETAAAISGQLSLQVQTDEDLADCDVGDWTGMSLASVRKLPEWQVVTHWPSGVRFPGGETAAEMQGRLARATERIVTRHAGEVVVAVSHADPIKAVVMSALGAPFDLNERVQIAPCSVTAIVFGRLGPAVLTVNSTASLSALVPGHGRKGAAPKSGSSRPKAARS